MQFANEDIGDGRNAASPECLRDRRVYNRWERGASLPQLDAVVRIAQVLQTSVDSLVGLEPPTEPRIHNPRLHALYEQMDLLSDEDQQALIVLMDSLVKRSQMSKLMAR
ncbi:hypothetical protein BLA6993_00284 [Burkholderia lata]|nr:hypothetical protein BLA6993_00284 [Burkholderia lata]